jgi:hypothetical protein
MHRSECRPSGAILWLYEWIVELYARYVLIRCSRFTNDKAAAQDLAAGTLATTCLLAGELQHVGQLSLLADTMADVIGRGMARESGEPPDRRPTGADPLLADERMRHLVAALNQLDRSTREVLVLHHVEGMPPRTLARLLRRSTAQVRAQIAQGEDALTEHPAESEAPNRDGAGPDVPSLLAALTSDLDIGFAQPIGRWAFRYLSKAASSLRRCPPMSCSSLRAGRGRTPPGPPPADDHK